MVVEAEKEDRIENEEGVHRGTERVQHPEFYPLSPPPPPLLLP